ncbi:MULTISPECIES: phosphatase PAP2 family protein [Nonomuraea]|uniref:Phosphatase PAP2 family protein n=1 Tax=Nonomuraea ferruginea TaxID=46174 RepID=A0ABT4T6C0_9ACTN|nr:MULTISPECIES: phosphatase PAP2 family protein [Nonomuraea]MDA0644880.1 phosphatase PAP2 family protein [Nonomuraea ferruginea]TXK34810.1 phosphatase PAP2 family protein [Nonomuraea sp. C10]
MTVTDLRYYALSLVLPLALMAGVTFAAGELILSVPTGEAAVSDMLAAGRTGPWNAATDFGSSLSDTPYIVALTAISALAFRWAFGRWRESAFLVAAVWSQSLIFLATTAVIDRTRPDVPHLDPAPPTSSFPSGHTSAAVAFYCGLALVLSTRTRHPVLRAAVWVVAVGAALAVAFSRLYRGMHFVSDTVWGLLLGTVCVLVAARAILYRPAPATATRRRAMDDLLTP